MRLSQYIKLKKYILSLRNEIKVELKFPLKKKYIKCLLCDASCFRRNRKEDRISYVEGISICVQHQGKVRYQKMGVKRACCFALLSMEEAGYSTGPENA